MLGVSRTTLREALRTLEEQRLIIRRRGLGTFVSERSILQGPEHQFWHHRDDPPSRHAARARKCEPKQRKSFASIAQALQIAESGMVVVWTVCARRMQRPVVWSQDIIPERLLGEHSIETPFLETHSLYQFLETHLEIHISHGMAQIRPVAATAEVAKS